MTRTMRLIDEITPGRRVVPSDLHQLRSTLSQFGLFDPATDPVVTESRMTPSMERALRALQASQGLRPDAVLRPNGPTETRLNRMLEEGRSLGPLPSLQRNGQAVPFGSDMPVGRVGPGLENHPEDVAAIGLALQQEGHIKQLAPQPLKTGTVFDGLKSFQTANGLVRDGIAAPNGPTAIALAGRRTGATPQTNLEADPEPGSAVSDAERLDAARFLDRLILSRRGERIDRSADDVGLAFRERQFRNLTPEDQEREIARLRRAAAPPQSDPSQEAPNDTAGRRRARLALNRGVRVDQGEPASSVSAELPADDNDGVIQSLVQRRDEVIELPGKDGTEKLSLPLREILQIAADPNHPKLHHYLDLRKRGEEGDRKAITELQKELGPFFELVRHVDHSLKEPFLVATIIQNMIDLDPNGLGRDLGFTASVANSNFSGPSPDLEAPRLPRIGPVRGSR